MRDANYYSILPIQVVTFALTVYKKFEKENGIDHRYHPYFEETFVANEKIQTFFLDYRDSQSPKYRDFFISLLQSCCRLAGKMCFDSSFSISQPKNKLSSLLSAIRAATNLDEWHYDLAGQCSSENMQQILKQLFNKETANEITENDLLEFGLYGSIATDLKSPDIMIARHQKLKAIYASNLQGKHRWQRSLPDGIADQSTQSSPKKTLTFSEEEAQLTCLRHLGLILAEYNHGRQIPGTRFTFGSLRSSKESSELHEALTKILKNDESDNSKIAAAAEVISNAFKKTSAETHAKRRLFMLLQDNGFTDPDFFHSAAKLKLNDTANAQALLHPNETPDAHPAMH